MKARELIGSGSVLYRLSGYHTLSEDIGVLAGGLAYGLEHKDPVGFECVVDTLKKREEISRKVNEAGIRSPRVYGVEILPFEEPKWLFLSRKFNLPGLVMEHIPGVTLNHLSGSDFGDALRSRDREFDKARSLGFEPGDHEDLRNAIWNPKTRETTLLDFVHWGAPGIEN